MELAGRFQVIASPFVGICLQALAGFPSALRAADSARKTVGLA